MQSPSAEQRQANHREIWARKPVLREVYAHLYGRMAEHCVDGLSIEVGGGSGNMKQLNSNTLSFDIVWESWLDFVADAQSLPLAGGSVSNILMLDVLHHIEFPILFFREAARVLRPGGRLIVMEPGVTPVSRVVYSLFHEEPVDMSVDPLTVGHPSRRKDPYAGNQAIPTLLFSKYRQELEDLVPTLELIDVSRLSFIAYPLSGGFKAWSLLPAAAARGLLRLEDALEPVFGPLCAFRMMAVLERQPESTGRSS